MRGKLVGAALVLATVGFGAGATRVSADPDGDPNAAACTGQVIAALASGAGVDGTGKVSLQDFHFGMIRQVAAGGNRLCCATKRQANSQDDRVREY